MLLPQVRTYRDLEVGFGRLSLYVDSDSNGFAPRPPQVAGEYQPPEDMHCRFGLRNKKGEIDFAHLCSRLRSIFARGNILSHFWGPSSTNTHTHTKMYLPLRVHTKRSPPFVKNTHKLITQIFVF